MMNSYTLLGIGVSTAGIVGKNGEIQYAGPTIPGYIGTPIKKELEELSGLPVSVVNDVDAALLGERLAGGAKGSDNVYCIALGTGIGGAYFYEGNYFLVLMLVLILLVMLFMIKILKQTIRKEQLL